MKNSRARRGTFREFEIEVYNSNGEKQPVDYSANNPDVSSLPQGFYTIRFSQGEDNYTDCFIKD